MECYVNSVVREAVEARGHGDGAGASSAGHGLAGAALPHADVEVAAVNDVDDLKVDAAGEKWVVLHLGADLVQRKVGDWGSEEGDGVRVAHGDAGEAQGVAVHGEEVVHQRPFDRLRASGCIAQIR